MINFFTKSIFTFTIFIFFILFYYIQVFDLYNEGIFLLILSQLLVPFFIAVLLADRKRKIFALMLAIFYLLDFILIFYHFKVQVPFNLFLMWDNRAEAIQTLFLIFKHPWFWVAMISFVILALFLLFSKFLVDFNKLTFLQKYKFFLLPIFCVYFFASFFMPVKAEIFSVLADSFTVSASKVFLFYEDKYDSVLQEVNGYNKQQIVVSELTEQKNVFFLHLESLNSSLVSSEITPNFYNLQNEGVLFKNLQTSNVHTIRSEENILCPVLPSLDKKLFLQKKEADLFCLPSILKSLGYKTLFFKDHDLDFSSTGEFMLSIGFDEVHNSDIMKPEDQLLRWGYREDIFYQRVLEYLAKYPDEKLFVYIAVSATNHLPFFITEGHQDLANLVPFPNSTEIKEGIANTTFLQDHFFGQFLEQWQLKYKDNSHLFAFGDQAWPLGEHGNYYNEAFAWQENFVSSLAIVSPQLESQNYGLQSNYVSHADILPTTLSLNKISGFRSLGVDLLSFVDRQKCIFSAQPYSRRYIAAIEYPKKYIYNVLDNSLEIYDLEQDPQETKPIFQGSAEDISYLENCLAGLIN